MLSMHILRLISLAVIKIYLFLYLCFFTSEESDSFSLHRIQLACVHTSQPVSDFSPLGWLRRRGWIDVGVCIGWRGLPTDTLGICCCSIITLCAGCFCHWRSRKTQPVYYGSPYWLFYRLIMCRSQYRTCRERNRWKLKPLQGMFYPS